MFIFPRPFSAVAAALTVALLLVALDRLCSADQPPAVARVSPASSGAACAAPPACGIVAAGS
jgi:hypothetical protein